MYWETILLMTPLLVLGLLALAMIVGCTGKGACNLIKANHAVHHNARGRVRGRHA